MRKVMIISGMSMASGYTPKNPLHPSLSICCMHMRIDPVR